MESKPTEAQKYVWESKPLQVHLHESEVTTLSPPPLALILAPRRGCLPLLVPQIKPFFSSTLPPGVDTVWFEDKGLPLKWYIPTGVLYDLLCAEPERPWTLMVRFRGYPGNILTPCGGEDSVKWSFINSLKEVSSKLKLGLGGDDFSIKLNMSSLKSRQSANDTDASGTIKAGRIPVRLYVRSTNKDFDDIEDVPVVDSWDSVSYINRPVEIHQDGKCFTLYDAVKALLPELFGDKSLQSDDMCLLEVEDGERSALEEASNTGSARCPKETGETKHECLETCSALDTAEVKLIRIQGIEPKLEVPFAWVVNNLMNLEHFIHISVCVRVLEPITTT